MSYTLFVKQYLLQFLAVMFSFALSIALVVWHSNTPLLYGNTNR